MRILSDTRHAARFPWREPGFTLVTVLALAFLGGIVGVAIARASLGTLLAAAPGKPPGWMASTWMDGYSLLRWL